MFPLDKYQMSQVWFSLTVFNFESILFFVATLSWLFRFLYRVYDHHDYIKYKVERAVVLTIMILKSVCSGSFVKSPTFILPLFFAGVFKSGGFKGNQLTNRAIWLTENHIYQVRYYHGNSIRVPIGKYLWCKIFEIVTECTQGS